MYLKDKMKTYLDDLASNKPAPGGGSAAAAVSALGTSLISMVCNFTIGKEKYKDVEDEVKEILDSSEQLRAQLQQLIDDDVAAYQKVSSAFKMPKDTDEQKQARTDAIQEALETAMQAPLSVCRKSAEVIRLCPPLLEKGNANLISDVGVAAELLGSAFVSGLMNVQINLSGLKDTGLVEKISTEIESLAKEVRGIKDKVVEETKGRL